MQAIIVTNPGGPEVLTLGELPDPVPGAGEVVIDVHAAALNRADLLQRRGLYPPPPGVSEILGMECAGVVSELGSNVTRLRTGDRVMALLGGGGYAERVLIPEAMAMPIPAGLGFEAAAAIPEAFLTARQALFVAGRLAPHEAVLIQAGASGVGSAATQLAHVFGATVYATASSAEKCARVRALGADAVIDYKQEDFVARILELSNGRGVDLILDLVGASYAERHSQVLADGGRQIVIGLVGGTHASLDFGRLLRKRHSLIGIVMRTRSVADKIALTRAFVRETLPLFASGQLVPVVDSVFPLAEAARAHERMEQNANIGKIILRVRTSP